MLIAPLCRRQALRSLTTQVERSFCAESRSSVKSVWKDNYVWTSPVKFNPGSQTTTALRWAKRRGPAVHHGHLRSLFRKGKIKIFLPATRQIKAVSQHTQLITGDQILIPKEGSGLQPVKTDTKPPLDLTTPAALKLVQQLKASILHKDDEMLIINKPQGLAVQGGPKVGLSLDKVMATALRFDAAEAPRLVHRLDKDATGCLVIARTADAAAWLSLAFAQHAKSATDADSVYTGATVQRQYMALVQQSAQLKSNPEGTITEPLVGRRGAALPASTVYRTLHSSQDFALLQLTPKTGRKHQLRIHCADALSAPIVGDARYGSTRNDTHRSLLQHLKSFQQSEHEHSDSQTVRLNSQHTTTEQTKLQVESQNKCRGSAGPGVTTALQANSPPIASNLSLQLHAHTICIQKPQEAAVRAEAKPAGQMESLLKVLSWAPHVFDKMT